MNTDAGRENFCCKERKELKEEDFNLEDIGAMDRHGSMANQGLGVVFDRRDNGKRPESRGGHFACKLTMQMFNGPTSQSF
jgi:hypothetical protein